MYVNDEGPYSNFPRPTKSWVCWWVRGPGGSRTRLVLKAMHGLQQNSEFLICSVFSKGFKGILGLFKSVNWIDALVSNSQET